MSINKIQKQNTGIKKRAIIRECKNIFPFPGKPFSRIVHALYYFKRQRFFNRVYEWLNCMLGNLLNLYLKTFTLLASTTDLGLH